MRTAAHKKDSRAGWINRLWCGHLNTHENFPVFVAGFFTAASLISMMRSSPPSARPTLSAGCCMFLFTVMAMADALRTIVWFISWLCMAMLFIGGFNGKVM